MTTTNPLSYVELQERIAALEAQARMIKAQERNQQIREILDRMNRHGIDIADLRKRRRSRKGS
ncbi:H-NS histone family protein [Flagellatimonas centrodinii]|uniref:H-NS family nucleoid-associated regulatory protein n=1 Tax=Flagellatimonas centrodinii TaxID=2806210 RepID=UPI001FFA80ED|nr:H-NS family nucleoid-associated regulatory protein [Flagellatimonas centrodinii]ULQ46307.1 H-NS histone family protein [Flagellatimonas centrodinii]